MTLFKVICLYILFNISLSVFAESDLSLPPTLTKATKFIPEKVEQAPTIPNEENDSRNIPQPEVRIIHTKDAVIQEYRVDGRLRYIKIIPSVGSPYYMVDLDGDGILETREDNFSNPPINMWILLEW